MNNKDGKDYHRFQMAKLTKIMQRHFQDPQTVTKISCWKWAIQGIIYPRFSTRLRTQTDIDDVDS